MAGRKTQALRDSWRDTAGAFQAYSPGAIAFLVFGYLVWFLVFPITFFNLFFPPEMGEKVNHRDAGWDVPVRWMAWSSSLFAVLLTLEFTLSWKRRGELPRGRLGVIGWGVATAGLLSWGLFLFADSVLDWMDHNAIDLRGRE